MKNTAGGDSVIFTKGTYKIEDIIFKAGESDKQTVTLYAIYEISPFTAKVANKVATGNATYGTSGIAITFTADSTTKTVATAEVTSKISADGAGVLKITADSSLATGEAYAYNLYFYNAATGTTALASTDYSSQMLADGIYLIKDLKKNVFIQVEAVKKTVTTASALYIDTGATASKANLSLDLVNTEPASGSTLAMKGTVYKETTGDGIRTYASLDSIKSNTSYATFTAYVDAVDKSTESSRLSAGTMTLKSDSLAGGSVYDLTLGVKIYSIYAIQGTWTGQTATAVSTPWALI